MQWLNCCIAILLISLSTIKQFNNETMNNLKLNESFKMKVLWN